jgi:hypothetical protein
MAAVKTFSLASSLMTVNDEPLELGISQPYGLPRLLTGIAVLFFTFISKNMYNAEFT